MKRKKRKEKKKSPSSAPDCITPVKMLSTFHHEGIFFPPDQVLKNVLLSVA